MPVGILLLPMHMTHMSPWCKTSRHYTNFAKKFLPIQHLLQKSCRLWGGLEFRWGRQNWQLCCSEYFSADFVRSWAEASVWWGKRPTSRSGPSRRRILSISQPRFWWLSSKWWAAVLLPLWLSFSNFMWWSQDPPDCFQIVYFYLAVKLEPLKSQFLVVSLGLCMECGLRVHRGLLIANY